MPTFPLPAGPMTSCAYLMFYNIKLSELLHMQDKHQVKKSLPTYVPPCCQLPHVLSMYFVYTNDSVCVIWDLLSDHKTTSIPFGRESNKKQRGICLLSLDKKMFFENFAKFCHCSYFSATPSHVTQTCPHLWWSYHHFKYSKDGNMIYTIYICYLRKLLSMKPWFSFSTDYLLLYTT